MLGFLEFSKADGFAADLKLVMKNSVAIITWSRIYLLEGWKWKKNHVIKDLVGNLTWGWLVFPAFNVWMDKFEQKKLSFDDC